MTDNNSHNNADMWSGIISRRQKIYEALM